MEFGCERKDLYFIELEDAFSHILVANCISVLSVRKRTVGLCHYPCEDRYRIKGDLSLDEKDGLVGKS